jgi:hypothetical protein
MDIVNISDPVWVQLTEAGKKRFQQRHKLRSSQVGKALEDYQDRHADGGWYRFLMWDLMKTFGPMMEMGCESPFELGVIKTGW